jgi:P pilus assembly chaperone PapD
MRDSFPRFPSLRRFVGHIVMALLLSIPVTPALAELMLYPTRIVLEGNQRTAQVELMNNGSTPATYRISLVNRRMSETGDFAEIDSPMPGEQFADGMLRFSPRQTTLAPGEGQTIRLMVRKPAGLEAGEYRSHLLFSRQPDAEGQNSIEDLDSGASGIGVQITALMGASIPVIVRQGATIAEVSLTGLKLVRSTTGPALNFVIERSGNQSVYGDLTVTYTPTGGRAEVVARANGVAVYAPNALRQAVVSLQPSGADFGQGTLHLTYRQRAEEGGELLAESSLPLP